VICTGGLSGTGKSVLAQSLAPFVAPIPGALVLRSDVERKALFGAGETERLPPDAYKPEVSERLYGILIEQAGRIARARYSVIVDAVFAKASERAAIEAVAGEAKATFHGLFLTADLETRLKRIGGRGLDASDADAAVARQQEEFDIGAMNWNAVDASGTPAQTLANARAVLGR
jgi:predicted kinase